VLLAVLVAAGASSRVEFRGAAVCDVVSVDCSTAVAAGAFGGAGVFDLPDIKSATSANPVSAAMTPTIKVFC
jgi:hypothetical protein